MDKLRKPTTENLVAKFAKKAGAGFLAASALATGLAACSTGETKAATKETLSAEAQVVEIVDNYLKDPENNPLPEGVEFVEVEVQAGDGTQSAGERIIAERLESGEFTSDDANNSRGTSAATSVNLSESIDGGSLQPGDIVVLGEGDINGDGKIDIVGLGVKRKSDD